MLQDKPLQPRDLRIDQRSEQASETSSAACSDEVEAGFASLGARREGGSILSGSSGSTPEIESNSPILGLARETRAVSHRYHRQSTFEQSAASDTDRDDIELNVDFQQELERLESLILDSVRIPLTELVVIDEGLVLDRVDSIRKQIPRELAIAREILQRKQEILKQAEDYARNLIESTKKQANRIIQESALVRQAELKATRIRIETQRECEQLRQETSREVEHWREMALTEYEEIQNGADDYARNVLGNLEGQLSQMLAIIRNGSQQLEAEKVQDRANNHQE